MYTKHTLPCENGQMLLQHKHGRPAQPNKVSYFYIQQPRILVFPDNLAKRLHFWRTFNEADSNDCRGPAEAHNNSDCRRRMKTWREGSWHDAHRKLDMVLRISSWLLLIFGINVVNEITWRALRLFQLDENSDCDSLQRIIHFLSDVWKVWWSEAAGELKTWITGQRRALALWQLVSSYSTFHQLIKIKEDVFEVLWVISTFCSDTCSEWEKMKRYGLSSVWANQKHFSRWILQDSENDKKKTKKKRTHTT